jgi:hypothetical protein
MIAIANVVMSASAHDCTPTSRATDTAIPTPTGRRDTRPLPGRAAGERLAAEARPAGRDQEHEDDGERDGLHEPGERRGAHAERLGDVGLEQRDLALHDADAQRRAR